MEGKRGTRLRACALIAVMTATVLGMAGQQKNAEKLPNSHLGKWYYTGSSGGMDGKGMRDKAEGHIVIKSDRMIYFDRRGKQLNTIAFTVSREKTIFATEKQLMLQLTAGMPKVINVSKDGKSLSLSDNFPDGYSRHFSRSRPR